MAKEKVLKICNLHKEGFCKVGFAEPKVKAIGLVNGRLCEGIVCEDFEGKYICGELPIKKV